MSALVHDAVAEIRHALRTLHLQSQIGKLDPDSVSAACRFVAERVDEIEQVTAPAPALIQLPVFTMADVLAEGRAKAPRRHLTAIEGGRT